MDAVDDDAEDGEQAVDRRRRRAGGVRLITILRKQAFDFSFLAASSNTVVTLRRALWLGRFHYLWYGVRIHNLEIDSGSFELAAHRTLPSGQDPAEFTDASQYMRITVNSADVAPKLELATASETSGPYLKFVLNANQGAGAGRLYAELSAVLLARPT